MRVFSLYLAGIVSLSSALPHDKRQDIDFAAYNAIPEIPDIAAPVGITDTTNSTTYDKAQVAQAAVSAVTDAGGAMAPVAARDNLQYIENRSTQQTANIFERAAACSSNPAGTGPISNPDTDIGFQTSSVYSGTSSQAATPVGYTRVLTSGLAAAQDSTYLTYQVLSSYSPAACAAACQGIQGCNSFNVFYERDPSVVPGPGCENPSSVTYIKCSLFGGMLTSNSAKNQGQYQSKFHVVIAGSNIYVATAPAAVPGFNGPFNYGNKAIQAPFSYIGVQTFPQTQPYDPAVCAAACKEKSAFDIKQGLPTKDNPDICNFFDAYILYKNGQNGVFTCAYYTYAWNPSYATNVGQYDQQGNHYTIGYSNGYAIDQAPYDGVCTSYLVKTVTPSPITASQTISLTSTYPETTVTSTATATSVSTFTQVSATTQTIKLRAASSCVTSYTSTTTLAAPTTTLTQTLSFSTVPIITQLTTQTITSILTTSTTSTATTTTTTTQSIQTCAIEAGESKMFTVYCNDGTQPYATPASCTVAPTIDDCFRAINQNPLTAFATYDEKSLRCVIFQNPAGCYNYRRSIVEKLVDRSVSGSYVGPKTPGLTIYDKASGEITTF